MRPRFLPRPLFARDACASVLLAVLAAAAAHGQSLPQTMTRALEHHPALAAQRAALRALQADAEAARGGWRPQVTLDAGSGHYRSRHDVQATRDAQRSDRSSTDLRLSAAQPLWNASTGAAIAAAETRVRQGQADLRAAEQAILLDAATAHLNVLQARQLLVLNRANERDLARQVEYRREYFERKLGTRTELAQAQARHALAQAQLQRAQADLDAAEHLYLRETGAQPGALRYPDRLPPLPQSLPVALEQAAATRPDVLSAELAAEAARADVAGARGRLAPSLVLEASGGWTSKPADGVHHQRDAVLRMALRIPLYEGGVLRAQVAGSVERAAQQQWRRDDIRLQARQDAADAWYRLAAARSEAAAFDTAIAANRVAAQGVRETHETLGELTLIDVLNARQELFQSEIGQVQAHTQATVAHLRLLAILGRLDPQDVGIGAVADASGSESVAPPGARP